MLWKYLSTLFIGTLLFSSCTKQEDENLKTLYQVIPARVKGLDPSQTNDTYSSKQIGKLYEGLLQYHYLKRPFELMPNLAESMPTVSPDGLSYTFSLKKGVHFHDNQCFPEGKGRELVASDVVFSIKRLADPKVNSVGWWLLDGKIKGLNEWREKNAGKDTVDYSQQVDGIVAVDKYTVKFTLAKPFPQFLNSLAMSYTAVQAKEAVDFYGPEYLNNPVGTGPFLLRSPYTQSNKIVYYRNPNYRKITYPTEGEAADKENGLLEDAGKQIPFLDKIVVTVQIEATPRWLSFEKGKIDYSEVPKDQHDQVVTPSRGLSDKYAKKGMILNILPDLDVTYTAFNNDDPLFKNNMKLRQAMASAYNKKQLNTLFYNGTATLAESIIPPGVAGHDKDYKNPYMRYDIKLAKKLLAEAGYPNGKGLPPITVEVSSGTVARQIAELFASDMSKIGIKILVNQNTWPQLTQKVKKRQAQMYGMAWLADYPDAENFLMLLYGPNASPGANGSNYNNPEYNRLFQKAAVMQDSPERTALYEKLYRKIAEEMPVIFGAHRAVIVARHGWLKNYKYTPFSWGTEKYFDIDKKKKKELIEKL